MTCAPGSMHVLLPVTRRLIDSQPPCTVNVVYRASSAKRFSRSPSTERFTKSRKTRASRRGENFKRGYNRVPPFTTDRSEIRRRVSPATFSLNLDRREIFTFRVLYGRRVVNFACVATKIGRHTGVLARSPCIAPF